MRALRANGLLLLLLSLMINNCVPSILVGSAGLRSLHLKLLRYFQILRGSSDEIDNVATKDHLLFGETVPEKLVQSDRGTIAEDCHLNYCKAIERKYQDVENSSHKFIVIQECGVWVHVALMQVLSHTV